MLSKKEMLNKARKFVLLERDRYTGQPEIALEWRDIDKWAVVVDYFDVLDKDLNLVYEPMPSSRDDEFLTKTRFSLEEAWLLAEKFIKNKIKDYVK